jgi:hypothetical protein
MNTLCLPLCTAEASPTTILTDTQHRDSAIRGLTLTASGAVPIHGHCNMNMVYVQTGFKVTMPENLRT